MNLHLLAQAASTAASESATKLNATEIALKQFWQKFWTMNWKTIEGSEWLFAAQYYGFRAMLVVVLMILAWTLSGWLSSGVRRGLTRIRFDETLTKFLAKLVRWAALLLTALTCLSFFGVETTSFAALIGAAGLAVGLAFQGTLSNFAAGAMLLIFRPYKVGDTVNIANHLGKVNEIALFTTEIDTFDGRRIIIPNSSIYGAVIENITYHRSRRVDIAVGTDYSADIDETRQALERAMAIVPHALQDPEPAAVLLELGASSVNWSVRVWVNRDDFGDAKQALIRAVKMELDRSQIGIPFPQMDVHLQPTSGDEKAA
ncbi:mechanosensitive ion channel family protein [Bythopirellula goksoeyrii]|uniref:Small-conductance mechanosensitive channel n=1 Tax=Bythopirellula goksoeyrii TaxID=1400387 RepID=A0A5B9Q6D5_9BACT|nr:mechanosensitive ion channel domain-containing protein [Bythopirellula goksoeyrii]QEG33250.1 Small-conductance mechanosensitive channel [Bythopirellula goksoeyrii]